MLETLSLPTTHLESAQPVLQLRGRSHRGDVPAACLAGLGIPKIPKSGHRPGDAGTQHPEDRAKSSLASTPTRLPPPATYIHTQTHTRTPRGLTCPARNVCRASSPGTGLCPRARPLTCASSATGRDQGISSPSQLGKRKIPTEASRLRPAAHQIKLLPGLQRCKTPEAGWASPHSEDGSLLCLPAAPASPSLPWSGSAGGAPRPPSAPRNRSSARPPCSRSSRPRPPRRRRCSPLPPPPPPGGGPSGNRARRRAQDCAPALRGCGQRRSLRAVLPLRRRHPAKGTGKRRGGCAPPRPPCRRAESLGRAGRAAVAGGRRGSPGGASRSRAGGSAPGSGR